MRCSFRLTINPKISKSRIIIDGVYKPEDRIWCKSDHLFDPPTVYVTLIKLLQLPDDNLQQHNRQPHMTVCQFRKFLTGERRTQHNMLTCPKCLDVGANNPNWKLSIIWVPGPIILPLKDGKNDDEGE